MLAAVFDLSWLFWLFIVAQFFIPLYQKQMLALRRNRLSMASSSGAGRGSSR